MFLGRATTGTSIYDPVANTMVGGPATLNTMNDGGHSLQRYDGTYLIMNGNSNKTMLYDAGWDMSGQYVSEAISPADINWWNTLGWVRDADDTMTVYVRTATTSGGLAAASWRAATNGSSIGAAANQKWLQIRVDVSRALPQSQPALDDVWGRWRAEFRQWQRTTALSLTANYTPTTLSVASSKATFAFGNQPFNVWAAADSSTLTNDGTVAATLLGQISTFTNGSLSWTLSPATNGAEQIRAQYSTTSAVGPWTDVSAYATTFPITTSVAVGNSLKLYFRIQSPTSTASTSQFSSTLTVTAQ